MADVIPLVSVEPMLWVCNCGCSSFEVLSDHTLRCAMCGTVSQDVGGWSLPDPSNIRDPDLPAPIRQVGGNGEVDFARNATLRHSEETDVVAHAVIKEGGRIHLWSNAETPDQRAWIRRRFDDLKELLPD